MLAVIWPDQSQHRTSADKVLGILRQHGLTASELAESERLAGLESFASGRGWHRATGLDRLSNEEARVIAARIVARLRGKIPMTLDQANRLATAIGAACARVLPDASTTSATVRRHEIEAAILDAGRATLGALDFAAFSEAVALGHWPFPTRGNVCPRSSSARSASVPAVESDRRLSTHSGQSRLPIADGQRPKLAGVQPNQARHRHGDRGVANNH